MPIVSLNNEFLKILIETIEILIIRTTVNRSDLYPLIANNGSFDDCAFKGEFPIQVSLRAWKPYPEACGYITHTGYITFLSDTLHVILGTNVFFSSYGNLICLALHSDQRFKQPTNEVVGR